ncbi:MAG: hypothetical protein JRN26_07155 [Nitrososphaerota archaeon]|nr:hypothetical protein [Nitrososphaerota archaeon]MDG6930213.1 hypothetical protein [Nitrososphaerota archaeon]MDG6931446.1 hypothetical protein [Nitrososphaerota archaeon]MDG6936639.1 hypothetical protein [Nitrososphaerota archaeon]MDG6944553.1 hypothetical protein [Nitrososphaerota archaeon]
MAPASITIAPTSSKTIPFPDFGQYTKIGFLTSNGNVFWVAPSPFNPVTQ